MARDLMSNDPSRSFGGTQFLVWERIFVRKDVGPEIDHFMDPNAKLSSEINALNIIICCFHKEIIS